MSLKRKHHPEPLTHELRKRLWWRARRLGFAATRQPHVLKRLSRKEWTQLVYLILIRHPEYPSAWIDFGPWYGPAMRLHEIPVFHRYLDTGAEGTGCDWTNDFCVRSGMSLAATVLVRS